MSDVVVRAAQANDFPEICRLAINTWHDMDVHFDRGPWQQEADSFFRSSLIAGTLNAFVAEHPEDQNQLVAASVGVIMNVMPAPWLPNGRMGYIQWSQTEAAYRRKGIGSRIIEELLKWFDQQQVVRIQVHASGDGVRLFTRFGFEDTSYPNLWLRR
jgi:GNAT superfamily N-acetyltransferase